MKVREVMTTQIVTATTETTVEEIAALMKVEDTGVIPVAEEGELIGLITDRDIVIRCVAEGRDPALIGAVDIVSEDVEVVDPDTDVEEALEIMGRQQIRRLPVVDMGELVGMLSLGDLAVKQGNEQEAGEVLKDVSQGVKNERRPPQPAVRRTDRERVEAESVITNAVRTKSGGQGRVLSIRREENVPPAGGKKSSKTKAS